MRFRKSNNAPTIHRNGTRKFQSSMKPNDPRRIQMGRFRTNKKPFVRQGHIGQHGNIKHNVHYFEDTFNGESAFLFAVNCRLKRLQADVSKVSVDGINFKFRVSVHQDKVWHGLSRSDRSTLKRKEKQIRKRTKKLDTSRKLDFRKRKKVPKSFDLEESAPELYEDLPRKR